MTKEPLSPTLDRFADLGGRRAADGTWPAGDEWLANHARPSDAIFHSDEEVVAAFPVEIARLEEIMAGSTITREQIVQKLMNLVATQPNLVESVDFERLPGRTPDGSYASPVVYKGDGPYSTFGAKVTLFRNPDAPKRSIEGLSVSDHLIPGLAEPHSIRATFNTWDSPPWAYGTPRAYLSLMVPGKDNALSSRVALKGFINFADPEALHQDLEATIALAEELFGPEAPTS